MAKMEMGHILRTSQEMQMQITPQQIMAANLLQLQQATLESKLKQEIEDNPALEMKQKKEDDIELEAQEEDSRISEETEEDYYSDYASDYVRSYPGRDSDQDKQHIIESTKEPRRSLHEYLAEQLWELDLDSDERTIAEMILINLSPRGFLKCDKEGKPLIFRESRYPPEQIEHVLEKVQSLDPPGIAAVNHQESFLIQLRRMDGDFPVVEKILTCHYEDLLRNRIPKIARGLGMDVEGVKQAIEIIRKTLTPHPASEYEDDELQYVSADVIVRSVDGRFEIELADNFSEGISVSPDFKRKLRGSIGKAHEFYQEKLTGANMIIRAIEQRRETLLRITEAVLKRQIDWFEGRKEVPRGITRFDISEDIGMHHSTVSRGVMNKYIDTPRGIFPFSYFFGGSLQVGDDHASAAEADEEKSVKEIKRIIRNIVDSEDEKKPLSDKKIRDMIEQRTGVSIARRTVAKYRESIGILSSSKRKKY